MLPIGRSLAPARSANPKDFIVYADCAIPEVETPSAFDAFRAWRDGTGPFIPELGIELAWEVRQQAFFELKKRRAQAAVEDRLTSTALALAHTTQSLIDLATSEADRLNATDAGEEKAKAKAGLSDTISLLLRLQTIVKAARGDAGGAGITLLQQFNNGQPTSKTQKADSARQIIISERGDP